MFVFCTLSLLRERKRQRWYSFKLNSYISWLHVKNPPTSEVKSYENVRNSNADLNSRYFQWLFSHFFILLPVRKILMNRLPRQLLCLSGDLIFLFTVFILIQVLLARKWNFFSSILLDTSRIITYKEQSRPQLSYLASVYIIALPDWFCLRGSRQI